jgi:hypothetical protein
VKKFVNNQSSTIANRGKDTAKIASKQGIVIGPDDYLLTVDSTTHIF